MNDDVLRFYLVDVFTTRPLTGNPLAVVAGGEHLPLESMRGLAREFNQSETTFVLPPLRQQADWRLRSFTPTGAEVFGAGHNALGAWWWLAESGELRAASDRSTFWQEIGERVLPVDIEWNGGRPTSIAMTQAAPVPGRVVRDLAGLAEALGLASDDISAERLPVQVVSTGAAHLLVPLRDFEAVDRVRAKADALLALLRSVEGQGCYVFSLDARNGDADAYARFFNPSVGIWEDPGTGSAAGPLAAHLTAHGITDANRTILIEQGTAMGRTSLIRARASKTDVHVIGSAVIVAEGVLRIGAPTALTQ